MTADSGGWGSPGHEGLYRDRVFSERARLAAEGADLAGRQREVLADFLRFNAGTDFGRRHGFGRIRTIDEFRRAVPINDYAALAPWIERAAAGESGVLSADDPVVYFTSSGSTGAHKKIPITPRFMHTTFLPFYYAAWAPLAQHFPDVLARTDAVLNLKHDPLTAPPTTAAGKPHVGASQVDFGQKFGEPLSAEPGTAAPWAALPSDVDPGDHLEKTYLRLRLAVQSDVRCLIGINPAMIGALPYQLDLWWSRIVKEVRDGTLGGMPYNAPDPGRAAQLEALADYHGAVRPSLVWPRMRALFCWTTGMASLYLPALREEFGAGVTALPAPTASSEGPVAVPLDRHPTAGSLVASAALYEFVDADADLAPDTATLLPQEIEPGRDYHVVFSHVGGLYRYAVGDVVRVVDQVGGLPRMEYAGRANRSDTAGERLREAQVIRALRAALDATGLQLHNAACRVENEPGEGPAYTFAISPRTPWHPDESARLRALLDAALTVESADYRRVRADGRLGPVRLRLLAPDAFRREWLRVVAEGVRPTQVKDRLFRQDEALWERLLRSEPS
ncbi:GH3 auxin-responsive promoter family protein [Planotetraspora sp. GP83]|uniref:GH3 auxin-responsive promoter family protein n=1 Tax=Planotetraspora sp. GP83 TaxID=3156264 RepID=UPI0035127BD6